MMEYNGEKYFTMKEACGFMGVSESFLYHLIQKKKLTVIKDGRKTWITASAIAEYFKTHTVIAKTVYKEKEITA